MSNVILPELGDGIEKVTVAHWYRCLGDWVNEDDDLVELVTDKAAFNIPAPTSGVIKEIKFTKGEEAKIGEILAVIEP